MEGGSIKYIPQIDIDTNVGTQIYHVVSMLENMENLVKGDTFEIDFSQVKFMHPFFALPCSILHNDLKLKQINVKITNANEDLMSYMKTIHFEEGFQSEIDSISQKPFEYYFNKGYIPIIKFPTDLEKKSYTHKIISKIEDLLKSQVGLEGNYHQAMRYFVDELTTNIIEHANTKNGWIFAQHYPNRGHLDICIADSGRSILGSYLYTKKSIP